jgi:LPS export ABC transporter protein LptC
MVSPVYIRPLLALLVMAALIALTAVIVRNGSHGSVPVRSADQQLPRNVDVVLKHARVSEIKDGQVEWELVSERVDYDKSGDTAYLSDIRMEFQSTGSHGAIIVTADKGEYTSLKNTVHLNGHVHVVTGDGADFTTGSIVYSGANAHFTTVDPVSFRQQRLQLTAVGMDLGVKDQRARFFSAIDASVIMGVK